MTKDKEWISEVTGGVVTRFDRTSAGRSRGTWLVDVEREGQDTLELVLRRDTGDGPLSGTELTLQRESLVYRALEDTSVAIPRLIAIADDEQAVLVERATGGGNLDHVAQAAERAEILGSYAEALAGLHGVDVEGLDLPGFARPATPEDHALADLDLWTRVLDQRVTRPAPMLRFALRWLRDNPPPSVQKTVLCHGDAGPGNFLFEKGRVSAVLDWEFAHLGDPMDDVAWFVVRTHDLRTDGAEMDALLQRYADASGLDVDPAAVQYYRVFVYTRMGIACLSALDNNNGAMDLSIYFALVPLLNRRLATLLSDLVGIVLDPTPLPEALPPTERSEILDSLTSDLGSVLMPELSSEESRTRAMGMFLLLAHLQAADTLAAPLEASKLDDLAEVLGSVPESVDDGLAAVEAMITDVSAPPDNELLLWYLARRSDRKIATWALIADVAAGPLVPVVAVSPTGRE